MTHADIYSVLLIRVNGAYGQICALHKASEEITGICTCRNGNLLPTVAACRRFYIVRELFHLFRNIGCAVALAL